MLIVTGISLCRVQFKKSQPAAERKFSHLWDLSFEQGGMLVNGSQARFDNHLLFEDVTIKVHCMR